MKPIGLVISGIILGIAMSAVGAVVLFDTYPHAMNRIAKSSSTDERQALHTVEADNPPSTVAIIEKWAVIFGNGAIIAAFIVAIRHIRTLHVDRTAHLVTSMSRFLYEMDGHLRVLYDRLATKQQIDLTRWNDPATISFRHVGNFFDLMAALAAKNVFDLEILDAAFGLNQFRTFYLRFANEINILREGDPERYRWIVLLATDTEWQRRIARLSGNH